MSKDTEHLDLLAVFHYVVAGLTALCSMIPLIHLAIGVGLATGRLDAEDPVARDVGVVFIFVASIIIVMGLIFSVLIVVAGRNLHRRKSYMFCLVMAGIMCLFMPFGTALGVLTIIVLMRDSVRRMFGVETAAAEPVPPAGPVPPA